MVPVPVVVIVKFCVDPSHAIPPPVKLAVGLATTITDVVDVAVV